MAWANRSESFRRGTAESQVSEVIQDTGAEIALRGFVDTSPLGVETDLHVTNLPNSGPWRVTVNGLAIVTVPIFIREGNIAGTIRGYVLNNNNPAIISDGTAIISGNEFYVEVPTGALRYNVSWEYYPDTDNSSTRTVI